VPIDVTDDASVAQAAAESRRLGTNRRRVDNGRLCWCWWGRVCAGFPQPLGTPNEQCERPEPETPADHRMNRKRSRAHATIAKCVVRK